MNTAGKFVFALVIVAGFAASAVAANPARHSPATSAVPTIRLDAVVVTPADVEHETVALAPVVVTPTEADWLYVKAHGVNRPTIALAPVVATPTEADWRYAEVRGVNRPAIALAPIVVTPTEADWLYAEARGVNRPTKKAFAPISEAEADGKFGVAPAIQDLAAFKPGQFLNTSAVLRLLDVLVFGDEGR